MRKSRHRPIQLLITLVIVTAGYLFGSATQNALASNDAPIPPAVVSKYDINKLLPTVISPLAPTVSVSPPTTVVLPPVTKIVVPPPATPEQINAYLKAIEPPPPPPPPPPPVVTPAPVYVAPAPVAAPVPTQSSSAIWQCIISHESGGSPTAANPSSTASGLFQFLDSSWLAYGGGVYASRAMYASVDQQWLIAEHAQAESGWYPWVGDGCTPVG